MITKSSNQFLYTLVWKNRFLILLTTMVLSLCFAAFVCPNDGKSIGSADTMNSTVDFIQPKGVCKDGSNHIWYVNTDGDITREYDQTHTMRSETAFYHQYKAGDLTRTNFYLGTDDDMVEAEKIPTDKLALTFWVYADRAVTFSNQMKLQLGNGGWGGWYLSPSNGAFSGAVPSLKAGWNFFCFDFGSAMTGGENADKMEYFAGGDPHFGAYEQNKNYNEAPFAQIDIWKFGVAEGESSVSLWFDDFKFVNTSLWEQATQTVTDERALSSVLSETAFGSATLAKDITLTEKLNITRNFEIIGQNHLINEISFFAVEPNCTFMIDGKIYPFESEEVILNRTTMNLAIGDEKTLTASIFPSESSTAVQWSSSDGAVASVMDGKVTAHTMGTAVISATATNGIQGICTVTVVDSEDSILFLDGDKTFGPWNFRNAGTETILGQYDSENLFSSSRSMRGDYGTQAIRTSFYLGTDDKVLATELIPSQYFALSFWIYANREVTLDSALKIQIGNGGWGGWYLTPETGALSGATPHLNQGWNRFYIDIGGILSGKTDCGRMEYYAGGEPHFENYRTLDSFNEAAFCQIDLYDVSVADGKGDISLWFDDIQFLNTSKQMEFYQGVRSEDSMQAALAQVNTIQLNQSFEVNDGIVIENAKVIEFNGYRIKNNSENTLFSVGVSGELTLRNPNILCIKNSAISVAGKLMLIGKIQIDGFTKTAFDIQSGGVFESDSQAEVDSLSGNSVDLTLSGLVLPEDGNLNGKNCIVAILPVGSQMAMFSNFGKYTFDGFDYYYQKRIAATQVAIERPNTLIADQGIKFKLKAYIAPYNVTFNQVIWKIEGNDKVSISNSGEVSIALDARGTFTVKAMSYDNQAYDELMFSLSPLPEPLVIPSKTGWIVGIALSSLVILGCAVVLFLTIYKKKNN